MDKQFLVHGGWGVAALVAFGVGSALSNRGNTHQAMQSGDASGFAQNANGANGKGAPTTTLSAISKSTGEKKRSSVKGPLSDFDILTLGDTIKTDGSPVARRLAFAKLLEAVTAENAMLIREQLKTLSHDSREWRDFHFAWGAIAGSDAVAHGMESPERDMAVTLAGWADADPLAATTWFDSLTPEERASSGELKYGLTEGLANRNPDAAASFVFDLAAAGDNDADRLLGNVARTVTRNEGVQTAATWTETLPTGPLRAAAMDRVANAYVDVDPQAAMSWAQQFNSEPHSARIIEEVADEVARDNPQQAIDWLASLAPSEGRMQGYRSTFRRFARSDTNAATTHVATMPISAERDAALTGVATTVGREQRQEAAAFNYIGQISDAETRLHAVRTAAPQFASIESPVAAEGWIQENLMVAAVEMRDDSPRLQQGAVDSWTSGSTPEAAQAAIEWLSSLPSGDARTAPVAGAR